MNPAFSSGKKRFLRCKNFNFNLQNGPIQKSLSQKGILLQFIHPGIIKYNPKHVRILNKKDCFQTSIEDIKTMLLAWSFRLFIIESDDKNVQNNGNLMSGFQGEIHLILILDSLEFH